MQITPNNLPYGRGDASFQAAGGFAGIEALVARFYALMDSLPEAQKIRAMHPDDLTESRDKLTHFLCGWLGGPRRYAERYGPINIPGVHRALPIGDAERDAWLLCMRLAAAEQPYPDAFKTYLLVQLSIPAERVRQTSVQTDAATPGRGNLLD